MKNFPVVAVLVTMLTIALTLPLPGVAQPKKSPAAQPLPLDPAVRTGKLANGFTYFIRRNTEPKNRVLFYLANKVGSILENDDQQGLAHFVEHMNFNGTTHFPKNELVNYLQKAGVKFGADINAYTSFDETVYQLPLPADQPKVVENGLDILHDWAQGALLETDEITKERGVILEEKRRGRGAPERMRRQYLPVVFNHSRYGQRLPIGTDAVLENFKPQTLRQFYKDWYRPDLQALIVVGDIDPAQLEATIRTKFADLKNPVAEKPRTRYTIPLTGQNQFVAVTDKEETATLVQVLIKHAEQPLKTSADYRKFILRRLVNSMLSERYQELSTLANPPFVAASSGISRFVSGLDTYAVSVRTKPDELETGFKAAWRETERVMQHGFTQAELDRAKRKIKNSQETSLENKDKTQSEGFMTEYLAYFLRQEAAPGIVAEHTLTQQNLSTLTLADVNNLARQSITPTNRDIIITAPEKDKPTLPGQSTVERWMRAVGAEKLTPYNDKFTDKPLLSHPPVAGKIIKEESLDSLKATRLTLSNGATVILKATNFANNDIHVKIISPGGASLYSDADYQSIIYAGYLATTSGIGDYTYQQLGKYLSGKRMGLGVAVSDNTEGIEGFSTNNDLESLLQVVYLYFTAPKSDSAAFQSLITITKASLANRSNSPASVFSDTVGAVLGNYSPRRTPVTPEKIAQISQARSYEIFRERFANAADFQFSFFGDFDPRAIRQLIETYIGSLPSTGRHEQAKMLGIHPPAGRLTKTVLKGIEPKASVRLVFSGSYEYNELTNNTLKALGEVLQIRLLERLREEEGGVYSPFVYVNLAKTPEPRYSLTLSFDCAPQTVDALIASALDEVNKLAISGPDEVNLAKFRAGARLKHENELRTNFFWADYFAKQYLDQTDLNQVLHADAILDKVTKQAVQEAAKTYLSGQNLIRLILLPEAGVSGK